MTTFVNDTTKHASSFLDDNKSSQNYSRYFRHGKDPSNLELSEYSSLDTINFLDKGFVFGEISEDELADSQFESETKH